MTDSGGVEVDLDVIVVAEVPIPHAYVFRPERRSRLAALLPPRGEAVRSPCLAYVVRHPAAGPILVDTGMHPDAASDLRRDFGIPMSLLFRHLRSAAEPFEEQLRGLGVEPLDVERVVMTHLHVDHTGGMRLLPRAEFVCSREEWAAANGRFAALNGYASHHLPDEARMRLLEFRQDGQPFGPFTKTLDLLGDGSVRLISTPGHTRGHLSVLLRLAGGRQALLVGDAAYTQRSIREEILPLFTKGDAAYLRSLREIKAFAESEPDAPVVPTHDPTAWQELRDLAGATRS